MWTAVDGDCVDVEPTEAESYFVDCDLWVCAEGVEVVVEHGVGVGR